MATSVQLVIVLLDRVKLTRCAAVPSKSMSPILLAVPTVTVELPPNAIRPVKTTSAAV